MLKSNFGFVSLFNILLRLRLPMKVYIVLTMIFSSFSLVSQAVLDDDLQSDVEQEG